MLFSMNVKEFINYRTTCPLCGKNLSLAFKGKNRKIIKYEGDRVLIRKDMPTSYMAVQAGHAVAAWLLAQEKTQLGWKNETLIYLGVKNERELLKWKEKLGDEAILWREPDIGNQATALAYLSDGEEFKHLRLI